MWEWMACRKQVSQAFCPFWQPATIESSQACAVHVTPALQHPHFFHAFLCFCWSDHCPHILRHSTHRGLGPGVQWVVVLEAWKMTSWRHPRQRVQLAGRGRRGDGKADLMICCEHLYHRLEASVLDKIKNAAWFSYHAQSGRWPACRVVGDRPNAVPMVGCVWV